MEIVKCPRIGSLHYLSWEDCRWAGAYIAAWETGVGSGAPGLQLGGDVRESLKLCSACAPTLLVLKYEMAKFGLGRQQACPLTAITSLDNSCVKPVSNFGLDHKTQHI